MSYKKDQGRYARMTAFWALFALLGYGCFSGLVHQIRRWGGGRVTEPFVQDLPLLGDLDLAMTINLIVLAIGGVVIHRVLNKPKTADLLIDTETELRKVTWPSGHETWSGAIAVVVTVGVLVLYLSFSDYVLGFVLSRFMGGGP